MSPKKPCCLPLLGEFCNIALAYSSCLSCWKSKCVGSAGSSVNLAWGKVDVIAASVEDMMKKINNIKLLNCLYTNNWSVVELTFNIIMSSSSSQFVYRFIVTLSSRCRRCSVAYVVCELRLVVHLVVGVGDVALRTQYANSGQLTGHWHLHVGVRLYMWCINDWYTLLCVYRFVSLLWVRWYRLFLGINTPLE